MTRVFLFLVGLLVCNSSSFGQSRSAKLPDTAPIQKLEDDELKAERTTNPAILESYMADDYVGIGANGQTPGKAQLLKNWQPHAGQAPPYSVEVSNMHIVIRESVAVAVHEDIYGEREREHRA